MKMIRLAAALAAMIGLVSCEEVLDSVITEPTFSVFSPIYDGQTCKLVKISACTYAWETDSPSEAVVTETGKKKRAWLTVNLSDKTKCKSIAITARNANDATVEPFTVSTMVHPWKLVIFKKDGDKWTECGTSYDFKGTGGVSIEVRMVALQTNGSWKEVDEIKGSDGQKLNWEVASTTGNMPTAKMGATKLSFDYSTPFQSFTVSASLGEETRTVSFVDDSVITEPTFSVFSTIYDGQTCALVEISACTYAWETDSPSEAVVAETGKKKRAWLTVNLSDKTRCKSIAITARNANDATVEPFTVSTMVHPWKLVIFKKDGDKWTECGTSYDFKGTGGVSIEVRMVALQANGRWKEVDKIPYEGSGGQKLNWEVASPTGNMPTAKMGATKLSFDYSTLFQSFTVSASLGEETRTVSFVDSTY